MRHDLRHFKMVASEEYIYLQEHLEECTPGKIMTRQ